MGVDIDPQAVEITMMSLYLKALEGERSLLPKKQALLPSLTYNIKCGNSLIGYDFFESPMLPLLKNPPVSPFVKGGFSNIPPLVKGGEGGFLRGCVFVRNSGTEDKTGINVRGSINDSERLIYIGERVMEYLIPEMKKAV